MQLLVFSNWRSYAFQRVSIRFYYPQHEDGYYVGSEGKQKSGTFGVRRGFYEETRSLLSTRSVPSLWILLGTVVVMSVMILYLLGIFDGVILGLIEYFLVSNE
jgi:hypothetical protein